MDRAISQLRSGLQIYTTCVQVSLQVDAPNLVAISNDTDAESEPEPTVHRKYTNKTVSAVFMMAFHGTVDEISEEFGGYYINFMHLHGPATLTALPPSQTCHPHGPAKQFNWPLETDKCWLNEDNILCKINTPSLTSSSSRKSFLTENDAESISRVSPDWSTDNGNIE